MLETDLLLSLAEIAGIFVGFGALIAVRSAGAVDSSVIAPVRGVLATGMATIIAALAPVSLRLYGLPDHAVLAVSSVIVLGLYAGVLVIHVRAPEYRESAATLTGYSHRWMDAVETLAGIVIVGAPIGILIAIALGVAPELEAALYVTAVVLFLVQATWTLLWLVFRRRAPKGR